MYGGAWVAAVHGVEKSRTRLSNFTFTFHFHALEKEMATHSSVLAWRTPGTEEPGELLSMGSHRVGHDWSDLAAAAAAAFLNSDLAIWFTFPPPPNKNHPVCIYSFDLTPLFPSTHPLPILSSQDPCSHTHPLQSRSLHPQTISRWNQTLGFEFRSLLLCATGASQGWHGYMEAPCCQHHISVNEMRLICLSATSKLSLPNYPV